MRLLYTCSELGLGHASRTIELGRKLEAEGHEIFFFSGGEAYRLLNKEFRNVYYCAPIAWYQNAHGIITSASLLNILFPLPIFDGETRKFEIKNSNAMETIYRYYDLRHHIREIQPDLLVSDGDIHTLRLGRKWKIPSVFITNLIRPGFGLSPLFLPGERFTERYMKQCLKIIVPDNPPPYTISEYNVGDLESLEIEKKVEFVGSFADTTLVVGSGQHVYAPISGPYGTRVKLMQMLIPALANIPQKSIVSLGKPGKKETARIGNCTINTWLSPEEREDCMKNASAVIFSGGHITCFETIKYAKPSIIIPTQPEQLGNGMKLQFLNCSIVARTKTQLGNALNKISKEHNIYRKNAEKLNKVSRNFRGLDRAVEIINTVLQ